LRQRSLVEPSRFDGVRYGYRAGTRDLATCISARAEGFGIVRRRILTRDPCSHGYYDAYYLKAEIRRLIADGFLQPSAMQRIVGRLATVA
jgi:aspartyl-tRNA(Asn)/glutamyl-tRNA(Gln) amidotransferase subunit A